MLRMFDERRAMVDNGEHTSQQYGSPHLNEMRERKPTEAIYSPSTASFNAQYGYLLHND